MQLSAEPASLLALSLSGVLAVPLASAGCDGGGEADRGNEIDAASDAAGDAAAASDLGGDEADGVASDASTDAAGPNACRGAGTAGATAACLTPTQPPEYYVEQALAYFDTLDIDADRASIPNYSELVARWEWPPWLLLTGYEAEVLIETGNSLRDLDPSTVPVRDCRFFDVQPFARCYVEFEYEGGPCPIYEEFVFNDAGEMTFIEAWSDLPGLRPTSDADRWAEAAEFPRLSTQVPGLGTPDGRIDLAGAEMLAAAAADETIADFVRRAEDFWGTWFIELRGADPDFFAIGCGWEIE